MNYIRKHYEIAIQFCEVCGRETDIEIKVLNIWRTCCPNKKCSIELKNLPYKEILELTKIVIDEEPQFANIEEYLL